MCRPGNQPPRGQTSFFSVADPDESTNFHMILNGNSLGAINADFAEGYNALGNDRKYTSNYPDPGWARLVDGQEYQAGNGWSDFDNLAFNFDNDPDFH